MERLTKRYIPNDERSGISGIEVFESENKISLVKVLSGEYLYPAIEKLADYEDLEEQGLLVRLPIKIGSTVWDNNFGYPQSYEIKAYSYGYCDSYVESDIEDQIILYYENYSGSITGAFPMSEIGKTVFLTREEAKKKLEEMKNE